MKLSFTTLGCPDWSFEKILDEAQRIGFQAIEIRGVNGVMRAEEIEAFFPENRLSTLQKLAEHGLTVTGFGTSVSFHDKEKYEAMLDEGRKAIDICSEMGFPFIRIFGDRIESAEKRGETIDQVIKGINALCAHAHGKRVQVLLEIHGDFNTAEVLADVLAGVQDKETFGILWDIEHSDKTYRDQWIQFYEVIKPYIRHTHIKDYHRLEGGAFELCLVGEGDIPIGDIVRTLRADGYDGYYSLEWEKKWVPSLPEPDVALPGYKAFMETIR